MNKQRKVLITITYNEMGIIIDTKAEEVAQPNLQPTCNQLATDCISRQAAIDAMTNTLWHYPNECYRNLNEYEFAKGLSELGLKSVPSAQPEIIHCRECKHYKAYEYTGRLACHYVIGGTVIRNLNDFCSRAERLEE